MLQSISPTHQSYIALWFLLQHSLSSFYKVQKHFSDLNRALHPSAYHEWQKLNLHPNHLARFKEFHQTETQEKLHACFALLRQHCDFILSLDDVDYPQQLLPYDHKPPLLFGQGRAELLNQPQIAIVGSREPSPHGQQLAYDFAYYLADQGFYINSGLAQGIDQAAHLAALKCRRAIAVMGTGIEQTYPSKHQKLRQDIVNNDGCIITEFLPGTPPVPHNFPRRNRIVSGLSLGVIVAEASLKSGSLITAKWAAEQGKTIFAIPGHIYSEHHQGCHQLIREGAILIDHPELVIEDLALATTWQQQQVQDLNPSAEINLPEHLKLLYQQLDWVGQDLDQLATKLTLQAAELTSQLMQLELLGLITQQSGLYLRCRNTNLGSQ